MVPGAWGLLSGERSREDRPLVLDECRVDGAWGKDRTLVEGRRQVRSGVCPLTRRGWYNTPRALVLRSGRGSVQSYEQVTSSLGTLLSTSPSRSVFLDHL